MFIIYFALFLLVLDLYSFQSIKLIISNKYIKVIYIFITLLILGFILYIFNGLQSKQGQTQLTLAASGLFLLVYVPKLWITIFLILEDVFRIFFGIFHINKFSKLKSNPARFFPKRFKVISGLALLMGCLNFVAFAHGIFVGRYKYRVIKQDIVFSNLPKSFDGYKVLQLSDFHLGSLNKPEVIAKAVQMINAQDYDLLVFTGDLVNSKANEVDPWFNILSKIRTPENGKYAILGNHDYGDYVKFDSETDKQNNFEQLQFAHKKLGFNLLENKHIYIKNHKDSIALIGIENWGKNFKQKGNLEKATKGVNPNDFKILLSHDPSHFEQKVSVDSIFYDLTLAGHTHGFQFGFELANGFQWSPVQFIYKYWAGLYKENKRYLYVNRGFGYHAYPGRVGIWPEITVLTLKSKK